MLRRIAQFTRVASIALGVFLVVAIAASFLAHLFRLPYIAELNYLVSFIPAILAASFLFLFTSGVAEFIRGKKFSKNTALKTAIFSFLLAALGYLLTVFLKI